MVHVYAQQVSPENWSILKMTWVEHVLAVVGFKQLCDFSKVPGED